jgi:hypothetical protein
MAYVPGFAHDVFVSYAHGDDRAWINTFVERLKTELARRLGIGTAIWLDTVDNRATRDFSSEIPDSVRASALFLLLPSPTYIRSAYCVDEECRIFASLLAERRTAFASPMFANELFAVRCPILAVDANEHWKLFEGLTDIPFHNESGTLDIGSAEFSRSFGRLLDELCGLLKRMRNHRTAVFVYPQRPGPDVADVRTTLVAELTARSYRVLPDRNVGLESQLREAALSVFLLGQQYDEAATQLAEIAASDVSKPWVVWCSPTIDQATVEQVGFSAHIEQLEAPTKTYLSSRTLTAKLKEEVLSLLRPDAQAPVATDGKPRVYLVYNTRDAAERKNAGLINYSFRRDYHFDHPDDPALHSKRLTGSDGVLLIWRSADQEWCEREFLEIVQTARDGDPRGLCVFDPRDAKLQALDDIRKSFGGDQGGVFVGEQFGRFDPARLDAFFTALRRRAAAQP